jgi:uncharacterized membrane protein SpoIIM required for sporulation
VVSDLSLAKTQSLPDDLIYFLNDLVGRAYHQIYRTEKTTWRQLQNLFTVEFPELFRQNWRVIVFAFILLFFGWSLGFFGYLAGPKVVTGLLPSNFKPERFIKGYETDTWFNESLIQRPVLSSMIMINNIKVAVGAFAGGMVLGTLTVYLIVFNGIILGVLAAAFYNRGYLLSFWAMILPHGVIELTAIGLSAAAGFLLAKAIFFPKELSRSDALKIQGPRAMKLMFATLLLFVIAALIEGFLSTISAKIIAEHYRLGFAALTGVLLFWYFRRGHKRNQRVKS